MPRILIMNAGTAQMSGADLTPAQLSLAANSAYRSAWFAHEGDLIVSPVVIPADLLSFIGATLDFDASSLCLLVPEGGRQSPILDDCTLLSKTIVERINRHIRQKSTWRLYPCYSTEGVARLAAMLGIPQTGDDFALQRGPDLLNRKSHFRQLATSVALPLPNGSVTTDSNELFRAVTSLRTETGSVIVKLDNGAGGVGNVILTGNESDPLPGARDTRRIPWPSFDPDALWSEMTTASCKTLVVESYHLAKSLFYLEYEIEDGSIVFMNSGNIRLRKSTDRSERALIWTGLELPSDLGNEQWLTAQAHAYRFVALARNLGYRGMINIDAIFTDDGRLLFNEANGRWGGGSVLHSIAVRLLGFDYSGCNVILSARNVRSRSLQTAHDRFVKEGFLFDRTRKEGVIPLAADEEAGTVECLVIARDRPAARDLQDRLLRMV
ncbi:MULTISPECIES: peptide ligase PGM1-related protein [unclassified Bradyrhizobium]|uniref:preATP grasp domain-containing protein n=1 Tax=unclassified Bradyrhizobium TaxID=2631580 RepID=UPI00247942D5|nr:MULTISPECIES: peptide ligase PGM1-related protein [unclassified Bradyrhizobium]WGR73203.1 peptide ligase PGM1-related protein [Bradyrhizobium sp. ISRA426]WGR78042.1 peptide ligase PGM1-related protein [Bradyrhizobium sp. ISRA430]WGR88443.1 peptide ligase PGM1-related protein [Bradyrhizobium sp. ISRA432]